MHIPKNAKNIILSGLMLLGATGSIKKYSDSTKNQQYNVIKPVSTYEDLEHKTLDITPIISAQIHNTLTSTHDKTRLQKIALQRHKEHSLPTPNYKTDPHLLNSLTQIRDQYLMYAGDFAPTQLEEFDTNTRQFGDALCASAIWAQLRIMNMRSPQMWQIFGQQEKHTRVAEQLLISHGRAPRTTTIDKSEYFNPNNTDYKKYVLNPRSHYHNVVETLASSQAGDFLTALYSGSHFKTDARQTEKNATHSLLSLGEITKTLYGNRLGFSPEDAETHHLLNASPQEQKVILLYRLLSLGAIRDNILMAPETQKEYIRQIMREFPHLLTIEIRKPVNDPNDVSNREIDYTGVQVDHVYPLTKQEALDKIKRHYANSEGIFQIEKQSKAIQRLYTNILHKNAAKIPYNFRHFTIELLLTNQFLFCDIMQPKIQAMSRYEKLSPTYTHIQNIRTQLLKSVDIGHTHIISFDDIDINQDNKINNKPINGIKDKTVDQIFDELAMREYKNIYENTQKTETEIKAIQQRFKKHLQKYFEILGVSSTGAILPIPLLTEDNIKKIEKIHTQYKEVYNIRQKESQSTYTTYILNQINKKEITINNISTTGHIVYLLCQGDDEITITQQIATYLDNLFDQDKEQTHIKIGNLNKEEYGIIYEYIKTALQYKKHDPKTNKPIIQQGEFVHIDLGKVIAETKPYYTIKDKLTTDLLPPIHQNILGQFDQFFQILEISPATANELKHQLIRENGNGVSFWDIAKKRSRGKYIAEQIDLDDNNPLKHIKSITSEGIRQIRIDPYTETKANIENLNRILKFIENKQDLFDFSTSEKETLQELKDLSHIAIQQHNNTTQSKNQTEKELYTKEYQHTRSEIRHILHDLINITNTDREHPMNSLSVALQAKLLAGSKEKSKFDYAKKIQNSITDKELNDHEIAFIQGFSIIASHLGKTNADQAFKITMANFLIQRGQAINLTTEQEVDKFCSVLKKLHNVKEIHKKNKEKKREVERHHELEREFGKTTNTYIKNIIKYIDPKNKTENIPYYNALRTQTHDKDNNPLEDGIFINTLFLESAAMTEFLSYINTIPPDKDKQSSLLRLAISLISLGTAFYINQGKDN